MTAPQRRRLPDGSPAAIDGGVHIAAQGGIWLTAVCGFAGVSLLDDGLAVEFTRMQHPDFLEDNVTGS